MKGSFSLDGVDSSTHSLVCKSVKRPLLPQVKVKRIEIQGLSGAYDYGDDECALRNIIMRIAYIGTSYEELRSRARSIAAWLYTDTWKQLIINDETDKYYLVKITSEVDLKSLYTSGKADISFDCQPFALSVDAVTETEEITGNTSFNFTNLGTRHINYKSPVGSSFLVTITGSFTTLNLTINGSTLNFTDAVVSKVITIDSVEMEIEEDSVSIFNDVSGDIDTFYKLVSGTNSVTVTGTGMNFTLDIDYRPLWL